MAEGEHGGVGHRERLRKRLFEGGPDALLDHELIEYLLTLSKRQGDTKALAKRLIREFGGVGPLLAADPDEIMRKGQVSEATVGALKIVQAAALWLLKDKAAAQPVLGSWQALIDYLHADMAHLGFERVRVLYLNARNLLVRDEVISDGSVDEAAVYVREIVKGAIECKATAIILVHNHPSGDPQPSAQDISLTRDIVDACKHLRINVHDHVIIGRNGHASLRALGLM